MNVWYDLDGVIGEFEQHFLKWLNLPTHHATEWSDSRFKDNLHKVAFVDEFWESMPILFDPALITYPIAGYCTARECNNDTIKKWLLKNGFPDRPIVNVGYKGKKGKVLKELGCNVMIDDSIDNYMDINYNGVLCYLMTRPHNIKEKVGKFRINNITEFMNEIKKLDNVVIDKDIFHKGLRGKVIIGKPMGNSLVDADVDRLRNIWRALEPREPVPVVNAIEEAEVDEWFADEAQQEQEERED